MGRPRHPIWMSAISIACFVVAIAGPIMANDPADPTTFGRWLQKVRRSPRPLVTPRFVDCVLYRDEHNALACAWEHTRAFQRLMDLDLPHRPAQYDKRVYLNLSDQRSGFLAHTERVVLPAVLVDGATGIRLSAPLTEEEIGAILAAVPTDHWYPVDPQEVEPRLRLSTPCAEQIWSGWFASAIMILAAIAAPFVSIRGVIDARRYVRYRTNRCPACGYSLEGLATNTCPECGRTIRMPYAKEPSST